VPFISSLACKGGHLTLKSAFGVRILQIASEDGFEKSLLRVLMRLHD
jgi:hypothetical protein